jgi:hypothetical protein
MNKRFEVEKFGFGAYDDFFCLRPPALLVMSLIFLCRGLAALFLFSISGKAGNPVLSYFLDSEMLWQGAFAAVPALLVLYALGARVPGAPTFVRWIWKHGSVLVALSALAHVAIAASKYASVRALLGGSLGVTALALADLGIIGYVFLSSQVRQAFLDFPAR